MTTATFQRHVAFRWISPIWIVLAATLIIASLVSDKFLGTTNLIAVLQQVVIAGVVALGMNVVLIGGHFDLSTGSIVMMAAVLALLLGPAGFAGTFLSIVLPIIAGVVVGIINGFAVYKFRANSIVATIGMQFLVLGGTLALVKGQHVRADEIGPVFNALAHFRIFGIPFSVVIFLALVVIVSVVMNATVFGRHVYAIGGDREASRRSGVNVERTGLITFMISGGLAAVSGVLVASLVGLVDPTAIGRYEFPALTAVVLGGTSLAGGLGRPADTAAAIVALSIVTNVMAILNYQYPLQLMVQGLLLTAAVAFYAWRQSQRGGT
jgi:ribose/xylose/arabinose/galactoside ABC-type transport system permease subunit